MKKILAIVGSPNASKSNTVAVVSDFLTEVNRLDQEIEYEVISLGEKDIHACKGCWACMKAGQCVIKDDLLEIQGKMLASDLLIYGSPVYVHQVSGQMKTFIDRMFIWVHMMKLLGKPSMTAAVTAQTGLAPVRGYLTKALRFLGSIVIGDLTGIAYGPGVFPKRNRYARKNAKLASKVVAVLNNRRRYHPSLKNHYYFLSLQYTYRHMPQHLPFEHEYWKKKRWYGKSFYGAWKLEGQNGSKIAIGDTA